MILILQPSTGAAPQKPEQLLNFFSKKGREDNFEANKYIHIQTGITHVALAQNNTMFFIDPTSEIICTIFVDASLQAGEAFDYM